MFRDTKEELQRLEQELLQEEQEAQQETEEEMEIDFEEEPSGEHTGSYVNYANGYRAYNSDHTDVDLEEFSEAVRNPKKHSFAGLLVVLMLLLAGVVCVLLWWYLRLKGVI